ncbi:MAG: metallophosphoesterase [Desulfobacterales bacterium]|nr:metallophosphoesterase [Desulfobacterales bacterium]
MYKDFTEGKAYFISRQNGRTFFKSFAKNGTVKGFYIFCENMANTEPDMNNAPGFGRGNLSRRFYLLLDILTNTDHDHPMIKTGAARIYSNLILPLFAAALLCATGTGCGGPSHLPVKFRYQEQKAVKDLQAKYFAYPSTRFVVLCDPHYHHPSLGTAGPAFEKYIEDDRKMLAKGDEILDSAISRVRREIADFILISGDLTKDGEKINHRRFEKKIRNLHPSAPVYVVPGNHDVANGAAYRYTKNGKEPVETVSPSEFRQIYNNYGYKKALYEDSASLSYVAEPVPGLWVLALDSCLWRENQPDQHPVTDGRFPPETLAWIEEMLIKAKKQEKAALAFMHHGLIEHYPSNEKYYGEYVVDNSETVARLLSAYDVRLVFTGHFHSQDITVKHTEEPSGCVYDIETGSLVTWPCPYRVVEISEPGTCNIESRFIQSIESMPDNFRKYAREFAFQGTVGLADDALDNYWVSEKGKKILSPQIAEAYVAHLAGDEKKPEQVLTTSGTGLMGRVVAFFQKDLVEGWWTDLLPSDNRLKIDLKNCRTQQ